MPTRTARKRIIAAAPEVPAGAATPDPAEVARLAYSYWESRGGGNGSADEDWLRAERELQERSSVTNN